MESGLIFNQLICEFESRHPCQAFGRMQDVTTTDDCLVTFDYLSPVSVGRSSILAEHRTVTAAREGSTPFDPPKNSRNGTVAEG